MGQCRKKREQLRVHGLLLLAYRLLRWPTIVTSRLPSSPAACFCPSGSRPFPLDFLLWGPFGHAATQVKFKPPSSPPPPSPLPPQDFRQKKHFRKTDCFDKERAREKTRFSVQKKHQTKRHKKHVLNDRPGVWGFSGLACKSHIAHIAHIARSPESVGVQRLGAASMQASIPYSTYSTYSKGPGECGGSAAWRGVNAGQASIPYSTYSTYSKDLGDCAGSCGNESQPWINIGKLSL